MRGLKQYMIVVLQLIIAVVVTNELKAQNYCVSGNCNPNTYSYSIDPNTIEYDNMISVWHSSMIREADGTVKVWGQGVAQNGNGTNGNVLTTTDPAGELSGANFGSGSNQLTGTVLKFAGASSSNNQQFAVLSTNGLYVWGDAGILVPNVSNVSNGSFRKVAIGTYNVSGGATKADGLPDGVNPADVKMMFGTRQGLAIVTCTGAAWVLTVNGSAYGDGATDNTTNDLLWHRVSTAANTPLNNVVAVRGTFQTFMALTASGDIYTWGTGTRLNDGSGAQNRSFATLITKPSGVTPKMIGMTQSTGGKTYYLLATDGRLFSMGENERQQLGYGGTTDSNVWGQVTASTTVDGDTYTIGSNVVWISPQEHDGKPISDIASINVITTQGKVWAWGDNDFGMLGYPIATTTSPPGVMPGRTTGAYDNTKLNMSDIIMAVETGGHTTLLIKQCSKKFGYVGHRIRGSMADGTTEDSKETVYNFGQTGEVTICGAPTSPAVQDLDVCPTAKANLNNAILSSPPSGFYLEWWTTPNRQANTQLSNIDILAVAPGTYYAFYIAHTGPCETPAYSKVTVTDNKAGCLDAVDDTYGTFNGVSGGTTASVLVNDLFLGSPVVPSNITLTAGTSPLPGKITMNGDGTITVAAGTPAGTYSYPYTICLVARPTYCDNAVATITVVAAQIDAVDDSYGPYNGANGGTTASVLNNDLLNGSPVVPSNITLTAGTSPLPGKITMNGNGTITVAAGTPAGVYTYPYTICENLNPTNCDNATATINVLAPVIDAVDDSYGPYNGANGGTTASVLDNDLLNGSPVVPSNITLTAGTSPLPGKITMNGNGTITVAAGTPAGVYTYPYTICENLNPTNCDNATATINVLAPVIDAVDDSYGPYNGANGGTTASVLDNDLLNGSPVVPSNITLTAGTSPLPGKITMNGNGTITVAAGTPAGVYTYPYTICENLNPTNCDNATATINVLAPVIDAVDDSYGPYNGANGGTTASVLNNDLLNGSPVVPSNITLTAGTSPLPGKITMNGNGTINVAAGTPAGTYLYPYTICENINPSNCDDAIAYITVLSPTDTIIDTLCITCIDTICLDDPFGPGSVVTTTLCDGTTSMSGSVADITILANGCIEIEPTNIGRDTICIIQCDAVSGICDTTILIVMIPPTIDTIRDTLLVDSTLTVCVTLENGFNPLTTTYTYCDGSTGTLNGTLGSAVLGTDGCITYTAGSVSGNEDPICVVACDASLGICDTTYINIHVKCLPTVDTIYATSCNPTDTGIVSNTYTAVSGCDSVVTTITTLLSTSDTIYLKSCNPADTGTVVQTYTNQYGCDSVVTTITTLLPSTATTVNATSCNPADTGTVVQTLTGANGCDSVVTTITTLLPSTSTTVNATSCNPADTGTVVQTLTGANGCDSVVTTITTLLPSTATTVNATSCNPADTGTVVQTLTGANGCDSVVTTITTLLPSTATTVNATSCNPADTGTVVQTLTGANGCDSVVTTITTLLPSTATTVNATSCNPADTGTVVQTLTGANGCDSVVTTITTLLPSTSTTVNATSCNPADTGTVVQTLTGANGCDSVVTTITTLLPSTATTVNATSCNPADTGTVVQTLTGANGCDSVVTTITTLLPSTATTVNATSCNPADTGTVVQTLTGANGCDSVVTTITTLLPSTATTVNATSCNPADTGTVVQTLTGANGCDSVVTTITTLLPSTATTVNATSCNPADTGTVVQTLTGANGCDSVVTTITTLLPSTATTINATSCNPADTGTVVQTLTGANGCDSVVTTITTLLPSTATTVNATSCNPADTGTVVQILTGANGCDSVVTTITTLLPSTATTVNATSCNPADTGTVVQTLTGANGCDSVVTTITTLLPSTATTVNATSCNPADTGTVVQTLTGANGCDSVVTTITTLLPSTSTTVNATSCNPADTGTVVQTLTGANGCDSVVTTITTLLPSTATTVNATSCNPADTGTVVQTLTGANGCDSVVTTITTLLPSTATTVNATSCNPADTGTVVQTLTGANGCDSVVTTITTLLPSTATTVNATSCNPADTGTVVQTLTGANGCDSVVTTITTLLPSTATTVNATSCNPADTGTVVQTLTGANGCDSVVTTITTLLPSTATTINATSCNPADTGTVVQTLTGANGCDSVVTTITTLLPSTATTVNATSCNPADTGTVVQILTGANGCDSVVTTITTLLPSTATTINATSCNPADTGTVVQILTGANGCDSVVTTITTLLPSTATTINATSCNPADTGTVVQILTGANGCDSVVTTITTLLPSTATTVNATSCNPADTGTVVQTLTGANGCDSVVTTITTLLPSTATTVNATSCNPADTGTVVQTLTGANGCDSVVTTITTLLPSTSTTVNVTSCNPTDTGTVSNTYPAVSGCDSVVTTITTLLPSDICTTDTIIDSVCRTCVDTLCLDNPFGPGSIVTTTLCDGSTSSTGTVVSTTVLPTGCLEFTPTGVIGRDTLCVVQCDAVSGICDTTIIVVVVPEDIDAVDDHFTITDGNTGGTTPSVLDNDKLNGNPVNPSDVTLTPGTPSNPALVMNPDGTITVAPGTPVGEYNYPYTICSVASPSVCDTARAYITVKAPTDTIIDSVCRTCVDTLCLDNPFGTGSVVTTTLCDGSTSSTGTVVTTTVLPTGCLEFTPTGVIGRDTLCVVQCDAVSGLCDTTIIVVVVPEDIDAIDDHFTVTDGNAGGTTPSVLDNDKLNGNPVNPSDVTLTPGTPSNPALVMNPDGTITVAPGTPVGEYNYPYTICSVASPSVCDTARAYITVKAPTDTIIDSVCRTCVDTLCLDNPFGTGSVVTTTLCDGSTSSTGTVVTTTVLPTGCLEFTPTGVIGRDTLCVVQCDAVSGLCDTTIIVVVVPEDIDAIDDHFTVTDGNAGGTTPSVLDNDKLNGNPVNPSDVTLTPGTPSNPALVMNPDGTITVAPGTPVGEYNYPYTICSVASPSVCDTARAYITVKAPTDTIIDSVCRTCVDTLCLDNPFGTGSVVTTTLCDGSTSSTGTVVTTTVLPTGCLEFTPTGVIGRDTLCVVQCDAVSGLCDTTIIVVVVPEDIDAIDDHFTVTDGNAGGTTPSVLDNDKLNGNPVNPSDVTLTPGTPSNPALVMNPDGTITVAPGTPVGEYNYPYTICSVASPSVCDTARAYITVKAPTDTIIDSVCRTCVDTLCLDNPFGTGSVVTTTLCDGSTSSTGTVVTTTVLPTGCLEFTPTGVIGRDTLCVVQCDAVSGLCDTTIIVVVVPEDIDAIDDHFTVTDGNAGGTTPSVLDNDKLNGNPVNPSDVTLTPGTPSNPALVMNPDGTITVAPGTPVGEYNYPYTICSVASPSVCDTARAYITVKAPTDTIIDSVCRTCVDTLCLDNPFGTGSVVTTTLCDGSTSSTGTVVTTTVLPTGCLEFTPTGVIGRDTLCVVQCDAVSGLCDTTIIVVVVPEDIDAIDDHFTVTDGNAGGTTPSVLDNDKLNGNPVNPSDVTLTPGTPSNPALVMNPDGTITVAPGTPVGEYNYPYTICSVASPSVCDTARAYITVKAPTDTIIDSVCRTCVDTLCLDNPFGTGSVVTTTLCDGSTSSTGTVVTTTVLPTGCLEFTPTGVIGRDTLCVVQCDAVSGLCDTTIIVVVVPEDIDAIDDHFTVTDGNAGGTTPSVLDNDKLNGNPVNPSDVTLTPGTPSNPALVMNPDGTITVAPGTPVGEYNYPYTICSVASPSVCDTARAYITVKAPTDTIIDSVCRTCVDTLCLDNPFGTGSVVTTTLCDGSTSSTGTVVTTTVLPTGCLEFTPTGVIGRDTLCVVQCDAVSGLCDTTIIVVVVPEDIDAIDDHFTVTDGNAGGTTPSVLDNDKLNGNPVNPSDVTLTPGTPSNPALVMNPDGTITVAPGTPVGEYNYPYTICSVASPSVCDTARAYITVKAPTDTIIDSVCRTCVDTLCLDNPFGTGSVVTTTLCDGSTSSTGTVVTTTVLPTGCLEFTPTGVIGRDTLCVVQCDAVSGLCDTTIIVVVVPEDIDAIDDHFTVTDGNAGGTTPSVLDNDKLNGNPVNPSDVTLTPGTPSNPALVMNPDGTITVAPGTPVGEYNYPYTICSVASPSVCDTARAYITVKAPTDTIIDSVCRTCVDTLCLDNPFGTGSVVTTTLCDGSTSSTGTVVTTTVLPTGCLEFTPTGVIGRDTLCVVQCDAVSGLCDTTIIVVVVPEDIDAIDDHFTVTDGNAGGTTPSVLDNDKLNGNPVNPSDVTLTPGTPSNPALVMNPDGTITVAPGTPVGEYNYPYTICSVASPSVCDTARAYITVKAPTDTIIDSVCRTCVDTLCLDNPFGTGSVVTTTLCDGSTSSTGTVVTTTVLPTGCLEFTPTGVIGRDTLCVVQCDAVSGLCDTTIIVVVVPEDIDAIDDHFTVTDGNAGGTTPSVLDNDKLNGNPVNPSDVTLTPGTPSNPALVMNPDGTITVAPGTPVGEYNYPYTICSVASPSVCDTARAYITVKAPTDTIIDSVCRTCVDTLCLDNPFGTGSVVTTTLCDGSTSSTGTVVTTTVLPTGCLEFTPTGVIGRDTLCVVQCDAVSGLCDTTIIVVVVPPTLDTIQDTVATDSTIKVCVVLENGFNPLTTTYTYCDGSTGTQAGTLGTAVLDIQGCVTYTAGNNPGNENPICVVACDASSGMCDTTIINIIIVCSIDSTTVNATSCNPADTGTVVQTLTGANGCDSVVTTITTLLPSTATTVNATSCNPADTGTVVQTLTGANGCDSVVTTITTLLPSTATTVNATSCNPADTGTVVQTLTGANGCDSVVTTITTLLPSTATTVNATSCNPADTGTVVQTLTGANGCDSVVTTITTLLPSTATTVNATSCNPADTGTVVQTLTGANGCDSVVTTITTLLPSTATTVNATSCNPADTGTVVQTLTGANGCDSVVTTITTLLPSTATTVNATSCNPADTGTVVQTLTGANGCDSVVTTITTLLPSTATTVNATSCNPADTGTVVQTLTGANGCDSVVTTITTLLPSTATTVNATSCNPADTGTVVQTLTGANGCDSVVTTITTLLPSTATTVNATSCNPADTGTVVQTLTGANGCDSVVTTITTLLPSTATTVNATSCNPADTGTVVQTLTGANGCDSVVTTITTLLPSTATTVNATSCNPADTGTVVQTLTGANGCDSVVTTITTLLPYDICNTDTIVDSICKTCPDTLCIDNPFGPGSVTTTTLCDGSTSTSGTVVDVTVDANGCLVFTPRAVVGRDTVCVVVCDSTSGQCDTTIIVVVVPPTVDTIPATVPVDSTVVVCVELEDGMNPSTTTYTYCDGSTGTLNGTLGEAVLGADGCVTYTAGDKAGKEAPICVVACDASTGICDTTIIDITVTPPPTDTIVDSICKTCPDTLCIDNPFGPGSVTTTTLCDGSTSTSGTVVDVTVDANGCLVFTPRIVVGRDTVCVVVCDSTSGQCDTTIIVVVVPPTVDTIPATVPVDSTVVVCVELEDGMNPSTTTYTYCDGSTGTLNGTLGEAVLGADGCVTYTAGDKASKEAPICVVACDASTGICDTTIIDITVTPTPTDTIVDSICKTCPDTLCIDNPFGPGSVTTTTLCDGSTSTSGTVVDVTVDANGCLVFTPRAVVGRDTVCVVVCDSTSGQCDTTIIVVVVPPTVDTIPATVPVDSTVVVCVELEDGMNPSTTTYTYCDGSTGTLNGTLGEAVLGADGCVTYTAGDKAGKEAPICVVACDASTGICDTTIIDITVTPTPTDTIVDSICKTCPDTLCIDNPFGPGSVTTTTLCDGSTSTSGTVVDVTVDANGCLVFTPRAVVGRDTVCVVVCDSTSGQCDTTIIVVVVPPTVDTIPATVPVDSTVVVCVELEDGMNPSTTTYTYCDGSTGTLNGTLGEAVLGADGCVTYTAGDKAGKEAPICVVACDASTGICDTTIIDITVTPTPTDTIVDSICKTCPDTLCIDNPFGPGSVTTTTLCDGSTSTSGTVVDVTVDANGCLVFTPRAVVGRDTVCVVVCDSTSGQCDTTIIVVVVPPTVDTIPATVPVDSTVVVCVELEDGMNPSTTTYTYCDGSTGTLNGTLGEAVLGADGCVTYTAGDKASKEAPICVVACDASTGICDTTIIDITVTPTPTDTIVDSICKTCPDTLCIDNPFGPGSVTTTTLCDGSTSTSGTVVDVTVDANGCLVFTPRAVVGRDTVCVVVCDSTSGQCDTTIIVVVVPPTVDTIPATVPVDSTVVVCVELEDGMNPSTTTYTYCDGSTGTLNGTLGEAVLGADGCVTYTAGDKAGKEAPICVVACDASTGICDTTIIDITVTPPCDIFNKDSLTVECNGFGKGEYCMPLSLEALANYDLYIDGSLTALTVANASGCGSEVVSAGYGFQTVGYIDNVPHLLEEWSISSDSIVRPNIVFSTLTDLVGYMNSVDASGAWYVDGMNVRPANPSASYRTGTGLVYFALQPEVRTTYISYNYYVGYSSANLLIDQGCHELKVVNKVTGCSDSIVLCVETCIGDIIYDTIPVKGRDSICTFVTPNNGAITITGCDGSVSGEGNFVDWSINAGCLVYEAGNQKGTDTICIKVCARESEGKEFCYETNVIVTVVGIPPIAVDNDTTTKVNTSVAIPVLGNDIQTYDDPLVLCTIITDPLHGTIQVDYATGIITYTPDNDYRGVDSLQYEICDPDGNDTAWVYIRIVKENECELLNAFSPNGDGVNDTYYIPCVDVSNGDLEFRVFNRWGIEVYHNLKYDNNNGWDGKYKGSPLPDGTYYYVIKYINKDNEQINKAGFIVIQR